MNLEELKKPMPYKWRVQSTKYGKSTCVAYVDSRDVQDRLDQVCGLNWSDRYYEAGGLLFCEISIKTDDGRVIFRSDSGSESNIEKEKGHASDAFKRAAVKFGVGRFLYALPIVELKVATHTNGKEYPATSDGKILWNKEDITKYINEHVLVPPPNTDAVLLKSLNTVGSKYYGKEWDVKRPELITALTKGRTSSSKELHDIEAQKLIDGIKKLLEAKND